MTFTPDIPQSGETLGGTRSKINANFQQIGVALAVNHAGFGASGEGKHNLIQMPTITSTATTPTTNATENALYTDGSPVNMYWRPASDGTAVQMTTTTAVTNGATGCTFLPGGLVMQFGSFTFTGSGNQAVSFVNATGFGTAPYSVILTLDKDDSTTRSAYAHTLTTTGFTGRYTGSNPHTCYYIAIGSAT